MHATPVSLSMAHIAFRAEKQKFEMNKSSQKFIARNRPPRVQIEYDVEIYGSEKSVELPFVMGVFADLSGLQPQAMPSVADRKFLEIDVDNFDERMKAIKPRAAFVVPNTLTGVGQLLVDVSFTQMEDFSPAAIASNIEPLARLLEARTQLANLQTYMDGKAGAEGLMNILLRDKALMRSLVEEKQIEREGIGSAKDLGPIVAEDISISVSDGQ